MLPEYDLQIEELHPKFTKGVGIMADRCIDMKMAYVHSIDAKKRLFIPAKHREALGHNFVICRSIRGNCLKVYPQEEWLKFTEKIDQLPGGSSEKLRRYVYAGSVDCEPDSQGRVVLNDGLVKHARLEKEAVIIGLGKYCEIWEPSLYEREALGDDVMAQEEAIRLAEEFGL